MNTRADIANESNRKLYQNHMASMAKLREARLRIEELEAALQTIVKARENRPDNCSDDYLVWCCIDTARAALEGKND